MTGSEKQMIKELALGTLDKESFLKKFGKKTEDIASYVLINLKNSLILRDPDLVEYSLLLAFNFFLFEDQKFIDILCALLVEKWHYKHEDIAMIFQRLKKSGCEENLYVTANTYFDYLSYNDCESLIVKCAYALGDINTEEAIEKLRLMAESENEIIRDAGKKQLERIGVS